MMSIALFPKISTRTRGSAFVPGGVLILAIGLPSAVGGCGKADDADLFREGVPYHEDVAMVVPGGATTTTQQQALTAGAVTEVRAALLGQLADSYKLTRDITGMVNGATASVLTLVKTITEFPPSSVAADVAVWGPYSEPLRQNTWRLTVNRVSAGVFDYVFDAKPRGTADSMFLTVLSGHHTVANPGAHRRANLPAYGQGDFTLDWDKAQKLPEHDDNVGKATFTYSRPSPTSDVTISARFTQVRDEDTGMLIDAQYVYGASPGMGGNFSFTLSKDAIATTAALETMTVRSRWQEDGAGRADIKVVGGDLGAAEATANECWGAGDLGFLSVYQTNSYGDAAKMWGQQTECVFSAADYAMF
jgi:hypothetical protein